MPMRETFVKLYWLLTSQFILEPQVFLRSHVATVLPVRLGSIPRWLLGEHEVHAMS
jgi:hypothetical protein